MAILVEMLHRINLTVDATNMVVTKMPNGIEIIMHRDEHVVQMLLPLQDFAELLTECDTMLDAPKQKTPPVQAPTAPKVKPIEVPDYIKQHNYMSDEDRAKIAGGGYKTIKPPEIDETKVVVRKFAMGIAKGVKKPQLTNGIKAHGNRGGKLNYWTEQEKKDAAEYLLAGGSWEDAAKLVNRKPTSLYNMVYQNKIPGVTLAQIKPTAGSTRFLWAK